MCICLALSCTFGTPVSYGPVMQLPFTFTVADALELEIFGRGQAQLVAGERALHKVVRWVHSAEIADIARFLVGGELLLTAGLGIGPTEAEQRAFIRSVADAGIAMLCVELSGRAFTKMPMALVDEAESVGLTLVQFGQEVSFVEVAAQVHNRIVDLRIQELTADAAVGAAFTNLLLEGEDCVSMVRELARSIDRSCVLEDQLHQLCAYSHRSDDVDALVADWQAHSRRRHDSALDCTRHPIVLKGEMWGALHVLHGGRGLGVSDVWAVERAVAAIAITLLGEQLGGARRSQRHAALLNRLQLGDINGQGFLDRALRLGRDLRGPSFVALAASQTQEDEPYGEAALSQWLSDRGAPAIVADTGPTTLAVVGLVSNRVSSGLFKDVGKLSGRLGISRVVPAGQLAAAVNQANAAHAAAGSDGSSRNVLRFEDLGVLRLLITLSEGPELAKYVEDELGPVLQHDAVAASQLLPTLRVYLECDGRKSEAAHKLFVQRRTLYYRLERLDALLDLSLDHPDSRLRLALAVRGLDLLRQRPFGSGE